MWKGAVQTQREGAVVAEQPDDATAAPSATPDTDLQPGEPDTDLQPGEGAEFELGDVDLEEAEDEDARAVRESVARRMADAQLVAELRRDGFAGPRYDELQTALWRYAISVVSAWVHSGYIFSACARIKRPVRADEQIRELLREDHYARHDLVSDTIASMALRFREDAFVRGGWSPMGGASLTTYYVNAVVRAFPNEYRKWKTDHDNWNKPFRRSARTYDPTPDPTQDPGVLGPGNAYVLHELRKLKPRERAIVALAIIERLPYVEIAEIMRTTERAVEGVIHRWLKKERKMRGLPPSGR